MNGSESIKKAAINKAKQVASAATSNGSNNGKKRRKQVRYCGAHNVYVQTLTLFSGCTEAYHHHRGAAAADDERKSILEVS